MPPILYAMDKETLYISKFSTLLARRPLRYSINSDPQAPYILLCQLDSITCY